MWGEGERCVRSEVCGVRERCVCSEMCGVRERDVCSEVCVVKGEVGVIWCHTLGEPMEVEEGDILSFHFNNFMQQGHLVYILCLEETGE